MSDKTHIMLDLETLGTDTHAPIIQIGLVAFNWENNNISSFKKSISLDSNVKADNVINEKTLNWWLKTDPQKLSNILENGDDIKEVMQNMWIWLRGLYGAQHNVKDLIWWSRPSTFDMPMFRSTLKRLDIEDPIGFRSERCVRTIDNLAPEVYKEASGDPTHDAIDDCIAQIKGIKAVYKHLGLKL